MCGSRSLLSREVLAQALDLQDTEVSVRPSMVMGQERKGGSSGLVRILPWVHPSAFELPFQRGGLAHIQGHLATQWLTAKHGPSPVNVKSHLSSEGGCSKGPVTR